MNTAAVNSSACTVLCCSCDKYADLQPKFLALFRKYWPDCPFPLVLVTESAPETLNPRIPESTNPRIDESTNRRILPDHRYRARQMLVADASGGA